MSNIALEITQAQVEVDSKTSKPTFVKYFIRCSYQSSGNYSRKSHESHTVVKRYSEILELHKKITKQLAKRTKKNSTRGDTASSSGGDEIKFPGKILFGNFKDENISKRKEELQRYFDQITSNPMVTQDPLCCQIIYAFFRRDLKRLNPNVVFGEYFDIIQEIVKKDKGTLSTEELSAISLATMKASQGVSDSVFDNIDKIQGVDQMLYFNLEGATSDAKNDEDDLDDLYMMVNNSPKDTQLDDEELGHKKTKKRFKEPKSMWFNMLIEEHSSPSAINSTAMADSNGFSPKNSPNSLTSESVLSVDWNLVISDLCTSMTTYNKVVQYPRMMMYKECCEIFEKMKQEREIATFLISYKLQRIFAEDKKKPKNNGSGSGGNKAAKNCMTAIAQNCVDMTSIFEDISESFVLLKKYFSELANQHPSKQRAEFLKTMNTLEEITETLVKQVKEGQNLVKKLRQILKTIFLVFEEQSIKKLSLYTESQVSHSSSTSNNSDMENDQAREGSDYSNYGDADVTHNIGVYPYMEHYLLPFACLGYLSELSYMVPDVLKYFIMFNCSIKDKRIKNALNPNQKSEDNTNILDNQMKQLMEKLISEKIPQSEETRDILAHAFQSEIQSLGNNEIMDSDILLFCIPEPLRRTSSLYSIRYLSFVNDLKEQEGFMFCKLLHQQYTRTIVQEAEQWELLLKRCEKTHDVVQRAKNCFAEASTESLSMYDNVKSPISITYETKSRLELTSKQFLGYTERLHFYNTEARRVRLL